MLEEMQKGSRHSDEARARISAALRGRPKAPEHRARIGAAHRRRRLESAIYRAAARAREEI